MVLIQSYGLLSVHPFVQIFLGTHAEDVDIVSSRFLHPIIYVYEEKTFVCNPVTDDNADRIYIVQWK